jgi:pimeloyl-[acyl-carrier protein] methyl ester esterase
MTLHITRHGQGMPLVLFHGWGFDSRIWHHVLPKLRESYEIFCVDLPGFGSSPFMDWSVFKTSILTQLPAQFAMLGWSLGGLVATRLSLEAPHRVTHLVNVASSPCFKEKENWPGISVAILNQFYEQLTHDADKTLRQFMTLQLPGQNAEMSAIATIEGLRAGLDWLMHWDLRDELSDIQCPVLYLFGRLDAIVPRRTMLVLQEKYPDFQYVMLNRSAHALFLSHPDTFVMAINDFLI